MPSRLLLRVALAAACVAGVAACAIAYASEVRLGQAVSTLERTRDFGRGVADLRASDSPLNPNAFRDISIGLSLFEGGRPAQAEQVLAAVVRREPGNSATWVTIARVQVSRKRTAAARISWANARRLAPQLPVQLPPPL